MQHPAYGELRPVTRYASVLLADNPSHMTLDGTNSWVVCAPGVNDRIVIDPGPAEATHLNKLAKTGRISLILLTHHHPDHTAGAYEFAEMTGAPIRAFDPELSSGGEAFDDGEEIESAGVRLRVLATPGHTADSVCFRVKDDAEPAVFTGDTILGRGSTVVAHPDGNLAAYLNSLHTLSELPPGTTGLTGHGPELPDIVETAENYLAHRHQRLEQVRSALRAQGKDVTPRQVVEVVYAGVDQSLWPAAEWTVRAQLAYLRELGEL